MAALSTLSNEELTALLGQSAGPPSYAKATEGTPGAFTALSDEELGELWKRAAPKQPGNLISEGAAALDRISPPGNARQLSALSGRFKEMGQEAAGFGATVRARLPAAAGEAVEGFKGAIRAIPEGPADQFARVAIEGVPTIAGGLGGFALGGPPGMAAGGAGGYGVGNTLRQQYEMIRGQRRDFDYLQNIGGAGIVAATMTPAAPAATAMQSVLRNAALGGTAGAAADTAFQTIEGGDYDPVRTAQFAALTTFMGAVAPAIMGTADTLVARRQILDYAKVNGKQFGFEGKSWGDLKRWWAAKDAELKTAGRGEPRNVTPPSAKATEGTPPAVAAPDPVKAIAPEPMPAPTPTNVTPPEGPPRAVKVNQPRRQILTAAIKLADGTVLTGKTHGTIVSEIDDAKLVGADDGFVTQDGRYVTRDQAMKIAKESGQVENKPSAGPEKLYTEHLDPAIAPPAPLDPIAAAVPPGRVVAPTPVQETAVADLPPAKRLKVQKEFLLGALENVEAEAPPLAFRDPAEEAAFRRLEFDASAKGAPLRNELRETRNMIAARNGFVTIEVPDDGTFRIVNEPAAIAAFREKVGKQFGRGLKPPATGPHVPPKMSPDELAKYRMSPKEAAAFDAAATPTHAQDFGRYKEIMGQLAKVPAARKLDLLAKIGPDLEPIKNRWGGLPPPDPAVQSRDEFFREVVEPMERSRAILTGEAVASPEKSLLPRRIEGAAAEPAPGGRPVTLADIRAHVVRVLDIPVRMGGGASGSVAGRAQGFFKTKPEVIRLKAINNAATLAHEVGHYLHRILFPGDPTSAGLKAYAAMPGHTAAELATLGARTSLGSYSPRQVQMEGVAEWTRLWLTDKAAATAAAPEFTKFFTETVSSKFPEVWAAVRSTQEIYARYIDQPSALKVRAHIDRDPRRRERSFVQQALKLYDDWVDDIAPIERALGRLVSFGLPRENAKQLMDSIRVHVGGWRGKTERDLFAGQHNLAGELVGPSLRQALRGLDAEGRMELGDYLVAKRVLEKHAQGIETGIDVRDAKAVVDAGAKLHEARRKAIGAWQDRNLQLLVDSGIITRESAAKMRAANQDYVPFYRVMEPVLGSGSGTGGRGFVNTATGVRRMKGGDRLIQDPLESIVRNGYVFRELAERNSIGRQFVDLVQKVQGGGRIADQVAQRVKPLGVSDEEVRAAIRTGMLEKGASKPEVDAFMGVLQGMDLDLGMKVWRAAQTIDPSRGVFGVWREGKQEFWQLDDPELLRSLLLMDRDDMQLLSRFPLARAANTVTRIKRAGATLTIDFMVRNPFRDMVQASIYSEYGFVPLFDSFRGLLSALKRDDLYWKWVGAGGRYADLVATDRGDLVRTIEAVAAEPGVRTWLAEALDPRKILLNLQRASELMEASTRLGEFGKGVGEFGKGGRPVASDTAAAAASKDVSLNFARGGFKGKVLNKIKAFFNASVLDWDKFGRSHWNHPVRTMLRGAAIITIPSVLLWWLNRDNERIQKLPEWRKALAWNMDFSDEAEALGLVQPGEGFVLSFPKPFLLGQIYGTLPEKALDLAYKDDKAAMSQFIRELGSMVPLWPVNLIPDIALPVIEHTANYSFFRDAPLVPRSDEGLPPIAQGGPSTSMVAQWLGEASGTSPWVIDNYVRGLFAGLGRYATEAVDATLLATVARDAPERPAKRLQDLPGLRAFVAPAWTPSADVGYFYAGLEIAEKRRRGLDALVERRAFKTESKWWRANRDALVFYDQPLGEDASRSRLTHLRSVRDSVAELTTAMNLVYSDPILDGETKRRRLIMLKDARDRVAGAGFRLLHYEDRDKARKRGG